MDIFRSQLCILILCCVVSATESQDNSFTVMASPLSVTTEQGATNTLLCQYNITDPMLEIMVEWFRIPSGGTETLLWTAENTPADEYTYNKAEKGYDRLLSGSSASLQALKTEHSLTFKVQLEDQGTYYCSVLYKKTDSTTLTDTSPHITVVVHIPPDPNLAVYGQDEAVVSWSDIEEAKPVTVRCSSPVTTPPAAVALTIHRDNQTIDCSTTQDPQADIHVCQVDVTFGREDNGARIWCRANEAGYDKHYYSRRRSLDIKFNASNVTLTQGFPPAANPGYTVNITCQTDSANPTPNILWRRASEIITRSDTYVISTSTHMGEYKAKYTTSTLSLVASDEHSGQQFDCIVKEQPSVTSNGSPLVLKTSLDVTIEGSLGPLHVDDILTLTCETNIRDADFKWIFSSPGGEEATEISKNQTYSKQNVQNSDAGEYTCEASTDWGFGRKSITVSVISDTTDEKLPDEPTVITTNKLGPGNKPENPKQSPSTSSAPDIGLIAGSIASCVVLIIIIIIIVLIVHRRKKDESKGARTQEQELRSGNMENGDASTQDRASPPNGPTATPMIEAGYATIGEPANHTTETAKGSEQAATNPPDAAMIDNIGYASIGESSNQTAEDLTLGEAADGLTAVPIADMGYSSIGDLATHAPTPVYCLAKKAEDVSQTKTEQKDGPEEKNLSPSEVEALYAKPDKMRKSKGKQNEKDGVAQEQKKTQTAAADAQGQSDAKPTVAVKPMKSAPGVGQKPRKRSTGLSPGQSEPQKSHEYDNVVPAAHQKSPPPKTSATNEGPYAVVAPPTGTGAPPRPKVKETTYSAVKLRSRNTAVDTDSD